MDAAYVVIRYAGCIYKIRKAPYETEENAYDRAWYIAKDLGDSVHANKSMETKESLSHIWANSKNFGMKFLAEM
jgi:hypothetical protein